MESAKPLLREYLEALLIAVIFATFARAYLVQAFKIPSGSMEENLLIGDHILVNKFVYGPAGPLERTLLPQRAIRRGDVVVFKYPEDPSRDFIKRCIGLPGDTIEISYKVLFLNGREVRDDSYVYHLDERIIPRSDLLAASFRGRDNFGPFTVPPDHYFCLGDNRDNSNDSRFWGPVPASYVRGRALLIYWSLESDTIEADPTRSRLGQVWRDILRIPRATRWERSFRLVR
jgi:signal peptidase I